MYSQWTRDRISYRSLSIFVSIMKLVANKGITCCLLYSLKPGNFTHGIIDIRTRELYSNRHIDL